MDNYSVKPFLWVEYFSFSPVLLYDQQSNLEIFNSKDDGIC